MRKYSIILLFFSLPLFCLSQNDGAINNKQSLNYKNQIQFEFSLFGFGLGYKKKLFSGWNVGVSANAGYSLSLYHDMREKHSRIRNNDRLVGETLQASFLVGYDGVSHLSIAFGFRIGHFLEGLANDYPYNTLMGVGFDLFYGRKIQVGFKSMLGFYETNKTFDYRVPEERIVHPVFTSTLLVLRVPVNIE
ncbi:MAG: hypothetical protein ACPGSO_01755 [Vicingaceae bacterium]